MRNSNYCLDHAMVMKLYYTQTYMYTQFTAIFAYLIGES